MIKKFTYLHRVTLTGSAEIGKLFDHSFILLSALAIIAFFIAKYLSPGFFSYLLTSEAITKACNDFMGIRSFGILFTLATISFRSFYIGIGTTRVITYSSVLIMLLNVVLAYAMIFGKYGFPEMGIKGAALASVLSELAGLIYLVVFTASKHEFSHFQLFRFHDMKKSRLLSIFHLSSPLMLQNTLTIGSWFLFFVFIERMGEHQLAISNIIRATYMILMTPIWAFASTTNSMVSNLIGQGKIHEVNLLVRKIINLSIIITTAIFAISFISPQWLLRITTSDAQLIADSMGCYFIIIGAMFLFSISVILLSTVSGSGNTKAAMIIEFINIFIYMIYVYLCTVVYKASIETVWFSEIIYWVLMGALSALYLTTRKWQHQKI